MKRRALLLVAALGAVSPDALADGASEAGAQKLFEEGRALMRAEKYDAACEKLAASDQLSPAGGTILNLADCYEHAGKPASAWAKYNEAADRAAAARRADAETFARDHARALEPSLSYVKIDVADDARAAPGLELSLDGAPIAAAIWGTAVPVDPGTHRIEARAPGRKPFTTEVSTTTRGVTEAAVPALEDDPAARPAPAKDPPPEHDAGPPPSTGSTQKILGIGIAAAGVVGLGIGSFFGVTAMSKHGSIDCPNDVCATQADKTKNDDAKTAATISTVAFVAGGVLLAGGVVLFVTAPHAERTTAWRVVPAVGSNGGRLTIEGRF